MCIRDRRHILQFAFTAGIAHRAIQRMVAEQQLDHRLARLTHLIAVGRDDHALGHGRGAGGLKLGHLLDLHDTHAAGALQRKPGIIAKRGHFNAHALAGFDQQRPRGAVSYTHLDVYKRQKPANGGMPAMASVAIPIVINVQGM